jgi:chromosome segregation ATPase
MDSINQELLAAIAAVVRAELQPLHHKIDVLTERVDVLTERIDALESRVGKIEAQLRDQGERLEIVEERVEKGFRSIKEDIGLFFRDNQNLRRQVTRQGNEVGEEILELKKRLAALESGQASRHA